MKLTIEIDGKPFTFELSDELAKALREIASLNDVPVEDALAIAIKNEKFFDEEERAGARFLIRRKDKLRELVREPVYA